MCYDHPLDRRKHHSLSVAINVDYNVHFLLLITVAIRCRDETLLVEVNMQEQEDYRSISASIVLVYESVKKVVEMFYGFEVEFSDEVRLRPSKVTGNGPLFRIVEFEVLFAPSIPRKITTFKLIAKTQLYKTDRWRTMSCFVDLIGYRPPMKCLIAQWEEDGQIKITKRKIRNNRKLQYTHCIVGRGIADRRVIPFTQVLTE